MLAPLVCAAMISARYRSALAMIGLARCSSPRDAQVGGGLLGAADVW